MDVKDAVARAKAYVGDLFADAGIEAVELKETEYKEGSWRIGVSFTKPAKPVEAAPVSPPSALDILSYARSQSRRRIHKVVIMNDEGAIEAMRDRAWMERAD